MSETYQIIFVKAGDGSPAAKKSVAEKIANATKTPVERMLKQIDAAPFIYKKGLPKSKAEAIAATLNKFGAVTEVNPEPGTSDASAAGAPAAAGSGAFDFGGAPAPPSGGFGFGGGAPSGGGAFGGGGDDFKIEQPSGDFSFGGGGGAASQGGASGFNFSADAAVSTPAHKAPTSEVSVERNADFMPATPAPAKAGARKGASGPMVTCPSCGHEQPQGANECASCGVVMSKARGGGEAAAQGGRPRPRARTVAAPKKSPVVPIAIAALVLVLVLVGAFMGGALNPIRLKLAAGSDPVLKSYGVSLAKPQDGVAVATVGDAAKARELEDGFIAKSQHIDQELARLATLSDLGELDRGEQALKPEIDAYTSSPASELLAHARTAVATYYPVKAVGLTVNGATYMPSEEISLSGAVGFSKLLNEVEIRTRLKDARAKVTEQQAARLSAEHSAMVNVSLNDGFDGALGERWQKSPGAAIDTAGGRLRVVSAPAAVVQAPRAAVAEPVNDYVAEVRVSGPVQDGTRLGLVVVQDASAFVGVVKARAPKGETAQVISQAGDGINAPLGRDVRFKLERKRPYYIFYAWNEQRGDWVLIDRVQPPFNDALPRMLGLTAFGGGATAEFDDFVLTVAP